MATPNRNDQNGHTSNNGNWDNLSTSSDTVVVNEDDNGAVFGPEFASVYPWGMDISITNNPGAMGANFAERSDLLHEELALYEQELEFMSNPMENPDVSSEELIRYRETRDSMKAGVSNEVLKNVRAMHDFFQIRVSQPFPKPRSPGHDIDHVTPQDEIVNGAKKNLSALQILDKVRKLRDIARELDEGNEIIRGRIREWAPWSYDTDGNNGNDEATSSDGNSSDPDGQVQQNTEDENDEAEDDHVGSATNPAVDGETRKLLPLNEAMASAAADPSGNGESSTSIAAHNDDEKYKIHVGTVFSPETNFDSRRVLLKGIPQHTTLTQIANAVTGVGGLVRINLQDSLFRTATAFTTACVEFRESTSAKTYISNVKANGLDFVDATGRFFNIDVDMIKTESSFESHHGHPHTWGVGHNSKHSGRCITLDNFPMSAVWYLLNQLGTKYIIRVAFEASSNKMTGMLSVELASTHEAGRLCGLVLQRNFQPYRGVIAQMGFGATPSDRDIDEMTSSVSNIIEHVASKHIELNWNVHPYNTFTPSQNFSYGAPIPRRAVTSRTSSLTVEVCSIVSHVKEVANVVPHILVRDETSDTTLREVPIGDITFTHVDDGLKFVIVGGAIFAREATGEVYIKVDGRPLAELKEEKVLKHKWGDFWGHYCMVNGVDDIRKWAEYGRIAQIRRNINKKLGRSPSYNPEQLTASSSTIPAIIREYINPSGPKVVPTDQ
ncbi:hypothetical protein FBEOM_11856 [Fusarium beomiforme]|uniref:RRM domain-containing protein n=1 Tax=Fusarium beomiforme TaxID=44412 RepID=A0A9P5A8M8_9HYPO|nr:hypothetical protein FBEOM_11856 [Fusarium beomiforme]